MQEVSLLWPLARARRDPGFYLPAVPRYPASAEMNPIGKEPSFLEARDVLRAIGYAVDRFQTLLVDQPVVGHRFNSVLGSIAMPPG